MVAFLQIIEIMDHHVMIGKGKDHNHPQSIRKGTDRLYIMGKDIECDHLQTMAECIDQFLLWFVEGRDPLPLIGIGRDHLPLIGEGIYHLPLIGKGIDHLLLIGEGTAHLPLIGEGTGHLPLIGEGTDHLQIMMKDVEQNMVQVIHL